MWLFLLLVTVPMIEIALFIEVGGWLGLWPTLGIVVLTALIGTVLLRAQGTVALSMLQARVQAGEDPTGALAHGALILVAGIVLLTPGFFTDAVGLALLLPPVRSVVIRFAAQRMTVLHARAGVGPDGRRQDGPDARDAVLDGEYVEVDPAGEAAESGPQRPTDRAHSPQEKP